VVLADPANTDVAEALGVNIRPAETTYDVVVGDVRHGSVKRVASAVGDGSIAIRLAHDYLA
jgi:thioredoxin reductase